MLSRAQSNAEIDAILDMVQAKNPLVLYQLLSTISNNNRGARTFNYIKNHLMTSYTETEYETTWRKSYLSANTIARVREVCLSKINEIYSSNKFNEIAYVSSDFFKLGLPVNTSATGSGIGILPTGSRISLKSDRIRSFIYWQNACDIDLTLTLIKDTGDPITITFANFASVCSAGGEFHNVIWFSGDCTSPSGSEFFDIDLAALRKLGYKRVIQSCHGYGSSLDCGKIYAGYQVKETFDSVAWDPKNIAMKTRVCGKSRAASIYGIDLTTNEIIILNTVLNSNSRIVTEIDTEMSKRYFSKDYLTLTLGDIISMRYNLTSNIEDADVIFADNIVACNENQKIINTNDLDQFTAIITV